MTFSNLNSNCSNLFDMRNLQEQVKKAFCYQKLFWPFTVWINCSSDLKTFANSPPSVSNFKSLSLSLEQFFLTVGQNNFGNKIVPFLGKLENFKIDSTGLEKAKNVRNRILGLRSSEQPYKSLILFCIVVFVVIYSNFIEPTSIIQMSVDIRGVRTVRQLVVRQSSGNHRQIAFKQSSGNHQTAFR